jgi:hypothetical protein
MSQLFSKTNYLATFARKLYYINALQILPVGVFVLNEKVAIAGGYFCLSTAWLG